MFAWAPVEVRRLALNFDQVQQYRPPPNPAKETDSRCGPYILKYGPSSWELDALDPRTIDRIVSSEIETLVDHALWNEARGREELNLGLLRSVHSRWTQVAEMFGGTSA